MGKLRTLSGREVCDILGNHGFVMREQKGSHIPMKQETESGSITVSVPNHKELAVGTLVSIIRKSCVPRDNFEV